MSDTAASEFPEIGSINYSFRKFETWKFKPADDSLILRVLPAMKSLIKRRDFGRYWKTHFGWSGLDERGKERRRPFLCIEEKRDKRITCVCDACELRKSYQDKEKSLVAKIADFQAEGVKRKVPGKKIAEVTKPFQDELEGIRKWIYNHGLDGKYRIPAMNKAGKLGLFLAPWNVAQKLRDRCRELQQQNIDPCGVVNGVWFEFTRNGKASPTSDDCQPVKVSTGPGEFKYDLHTLDKSTLILAQESIPDLEEMMERGRIRPDQVTALVNCSGDPEEVDRILEIDHTKQNSGFGPDDDEYAATPASVGTVGAGTVADDAFGESTSKPSEKPKAEVKAAESTTEDVEEAELERQLAVKKAAKAAKFAKTVEAESAPTNKVEAKPETTAKTAAEVSDADFEKLFG